MPAPSSATARIRVQENAVKERGMAVSICARGAAA
jgi:hypothetical protein